MQSMNGSKDYYNILKCILNNPNGIACLNEDAIYLTSLLPLLGTLKPTKRRPDAFAENGTMVLLLEHFQFDNSKLNRKGSVQNQTSANTSRKLNELLDDNTTHAVVSENVKKCGIYYVENFRTQFYSHAKNIGNYKLEIQKETGKKYDESLMGFVIEDSSPLGSVYYDHGPKCVDLLFAKEFLDVFEQTCQLDFVIFAMTGNNENRLLSFITQNTIAQHREREIEVAKIPKFLFEDSICASSKIFIPSDFNSVQ